MTNVLLQIGAICAALAGIGIVIRGLWRANRRIVRIADAVEELSPNRGDSIKDTITRVDRNLTELTRRFNHHLTHHPKG